MANNVVSKERIFNCQKNKVISKELYKMNKLIQELFKLAIEYTIPMPTWFIQIYLRTLSNDELMMIKFMCDRARKNNQ